MIKNVDPQITQISQIRFWFLSRHPRLAMRHPGLAISPFWSSHTVLPRSRNGRPNRKSRSIRSSGTPLVAGTKRKQSQRPANERAAYSKNVQTAFCSGSICSGGPVLPCVAEGRASAYILDNRSSVAL